MILTAVAVVLIAWGAYSIFSGGDDDDSDTTAAGTSAATAPAAPAGGQSGAGAPTAQSGTPGAGAPGADRPGAAPDAASGAPAAPAAGAAPQGGGNASPGAVDRKTPVTVLNNSGQALAKDATADIRGRQWTNTGYGNLQGRIEGISEESRVYYPEGDATAQAAAEELAGELGISAQAGNHDYYDRFRSADIREGAKADGVVVVLTQPLR
ncbi:MAG TPA: hypothetical protein DIW82_07535 [Corynebacterium nuruki]|uniref:LytR/CpsA/Psr regulator C-terminal domain-containing protein n=3 Tax=Corynebacterium nuruki TaxID=1032851 RepID=A0A3D4SZE4_9CORY|nr:hypothetical protein [Corynebacterium nuruki]